MQFGLSMFITDETIAPVALGRAAEDAGFDSFWVPEHTHIPASRLAPYPGGGELPREYSHRSTRSYARSAAAVTERLRSAPGSPVVEHDPIILAKEVASLDHLSSGRFLLRHRGRLEPRGDARPRHRPGRAGRCMRERVRP